MAKQTIKTGSRVTVTITAGAIVSAKVVKGKLVQTYADATVQIAGTVPDVPQPTGPTLPPVLPPVNPAPVFTTLPSISPTTGTAGSTVYTINDGVSTYTTTKTRRILLGSTLIGTGTTITSANAGQMTVEVTAVGPGGTTKATSAAVTVTAAPIPGAKRITVTGDSWTVDYGGYYAGAYKELRQNVHTFSMQGVGSSGLNDLVNREAAVIASAPDVLHIGIGRNDLNSTFQYDTDQKWLDALWAHIARIKAALPNVRVMVETLCAEQRPNLSGPNTIYNNRRANINASIRAAVGTKIYGVIDFAASSEIGDDNDFLPTAIGPYCITNDGLHLWDRSNGGRTGHDIAFEIYTAAMDGAIAGNVVTPPATGDFQITQTSTRGAKPFAWQIEDPSGAGAGSYWWAQRATGSTIAQATANLLAGNLNGSAVQMVEESDIYGGDVVFAGLGTTPSGPMALRLGYGHDDGSGGYVWEVQSNVLTDTIT